MEPETTNDEAAPQGAEGRPDRPRRSSRARRGTRRARRLGPIAQMRARLRRRVSAGAGRISDNAGPAIGDTRRLTRERLAATRGPLQRLGSGLVGAGTDLLAVFFGAVERLALAIERPTVSAARAAAGRGRAITDWAIRELTPARLGVAVIAGAVLVLVASQSADYRAVAVGTSDYQAVGSAAPAPLVNRQDPTSAHGIAIYGLAALAAMLLVTMVRTRRPRIGRLVGVLGLAVIAISLAVDVPASREFDQATRDYVGAAPELLGGFWAQLAAGAVLLVSGLTTSTREAPAPVRTRPTRRRGADGGNLAETEGAPA